MSLTQVGPHSFTYDGNGAVGTRTISGVTQTLTYDKAHRLTTIAGGGDTTTFLCDADGNRVRTTTNGTHTFQWGDWTWTPGDDPEMVYRFAGALVAARDGDGKLWWSIDDHLSSTTVQYHAGTDTVRHQRYLPFGQVRINDGTVTDVGYTGQRLDATGLMFYQARYYDPLIGRFTTADTIVPDPTNPQDLNRYTYVNNNPLKYTDPSGHCTTVTADGVCVIYANGATWRLGPNGTTVTAVTVDAQDHMESLDGFASSCDWTSCTYSARGESADSLGPSAEDLLMVGLETLKLLPDLPSGMDNAIKVEPLKPLRGVLEYAEEPITWRIDVSGLPPSMQHRFSAEWAKGAAKKFRGVSMYLAFVTDIPDYIEGNQKAGFGSSRRRNRWWYGRCLHGRSSVLHDGKRGIVRCRHSDRRLRGWCLGR